MNALLSGHEATPFARQLRGALVAALARAGDPTRAAAQKAYMKSTMDCHGVAMAEVKKIAKEVAKKHPPKTTEQWQEACLYVWHAAEKREERYFCEEWTGLAIARAWQVPALMPMYEDMIVSGAWWDLVDWLAAHRVGTLLLKYRAVLAPVLRAWSTDDNIWKRRTAILSQIRHKADTDFAFLQAVIEPSLEVAEGGRARPGGSDLRQRTAMDDFFLRKAIGWALREYGAVDGDAVRAWVKENEARLSGLSRREALKHL